MKNSIFLYDISALSLTGFEDSQVEEMGNLVSCSLWLDGDADAGYGKSILIFTGQSIGFPK